MGTTPTHGYPYPEPTDPVAAGADAIKALALAVERRTAIPAPQYVLGGGPTFGGTWTNILTLTANVPPANAPGPWTLHCVGSTNYFPRNVGILQVFNQLLCGGTVGPEVFRYMNVGTAHPQFVDDIGTCFAQYTWPVAPPPGDAVCTLRAASADSVAYPTNGKCWIACWWS